MTNAPSFTSGRFNSDADVIRAFSQAQAQFQSTGNRVIELSADAGVGRAFLRRDQLPPGVEPLDETPFENLPDVVEITVTRIRAVFNADGSIKTIYPLGWIIPMFRIHDQYPEASLHPSPDQPPVSDLEDAWYAWRPAGLAAEIQIGDYRLPAVGLAYIELVRFDLLALAESLRDRPPLLPADRKIASRLGLEEPVYPLILGEHVYNIPILLFQPQGDDVHMYTRTFLEGGSGDIGILAGRDLSDPVTTTRTQVIGEIRRFLERHLAYYLSMYPSIENGSMYRDWSRRVSALALRSGA
jgi:hypothetical protein